ncbi:cdc42 effector protein 4a [Chanos chanos]|uniref:Cdc42 effector protein 4a n=1 Tax=Chanos chanos TaxID=29144 RepID=A0A6J2WN19_CHACN|nr:cdc42 effector protein 4-like [Chanos chanos]
MPILKQLVAGSSQTKRRSRMDLTTEMISAPLGDFRHTMHVGRSGDAFGDTSFLSSHSGEPPRETRAFPRSPKPGLLTRTFKASKRSQSVTRVDKRENLLVPPDGSPTFVKNAMSLPFLNDENGGQGDGGRALKSLSSSPMKQQPSNGATGHVLDLEMHEQLFGELTDLRSIPQFNGGGLKKAESVMSFHVDLGPSMLGDILGVMEKEDDDLGFEEGKSSEGRASPPLSAQGGDEEEQAEEEEEEEEEAEEEEDVVTLNKEEQPKEAEVEINDQPPTSVDPENQVETHDSPKLQPTHQQHLDSCSVSSSSSAALEEKPASQKNEGDTDSTNYYSHQGDEGAFSSFLEDEDDEIRV